MSTPCQRCAWRTRATSSSPPPNCSADYGNLHAAKRFLHGQLVGDRSYSGNALRDFRDLANLGCVRDRAIERHRAVFRETLIFPALISLFFAMAL